MVSFCEVAYNLRRIINILDSWSGCFQKVPESLLLKVMCLFQGHKGNLEKNNVLTTSADIHKKNIKYLINAFIFGNKLRIPVGYETN